MSSLVILPSHRGNRIWESYLLGQTKLHVSQLLAGIVVMLGQTLMLSSGSLHFLLLFRSVHGWTPTMSRPSDPARTSHEEPQLSHMEVCGRAKQAARVPTPRRVALSFSLAAGDRRWVSSDPTTSLPNINNSATSFRLGRDKYHTTLALILSHLLCVEYCI